MTSRFVRVAMLIAIAATLLPHPVSAHAEENKTTLVFEIKSIKIPTTSNITDLLDGDKPKTSTGKLGPVTPPAPVAVIKTTAKVIYNLPAKKVGDERVYMQEPEIRAYLCPKLGDRCNTFIAILKAENGTHECTRDNRGLNRNGSVDIGLAQINWNPSSPYTFEQLQDCKFNLDIAMKKIASRGFQPWYAYTKGAYLKHLPAVLASAKIVAPVSTAVAIE